ncbi:hypothetical protein L2E82_41242 [Cichorium intybus]|uniref:Uncharacterized protein n=1 Tax=Cichorium intybus TaxID=13427 RepID=A0ACB9ANE3_CICIN|nr:hypothetical protein L2E82_41242 [Cichorium intybus]
MSQCVPSWNLEDINNNHNLFKLDYEVAELTWENGQLAMHELGNRRVPSKSDSSTSNLPKYTWNKPRAAETLEAIVDQATLQPFGKHQIAMSDEEVVPWLQKHTPTVATGNSNASGTMTSDALVPSSNNRTDERYVQAHRSIKNAHDAGCSTRVGSCSGEPSTYLERGVARDGGSTTATAYEWSSCRDLTASDGSGTFGTIDTLGGYFGGSRLPSTSNGSPENTSSGKDYSKSTSPDDSMYHCRPQSPPKGVREKKKGKAKPSISNKRRRTAAIHNQSERKRRDKINQRMKTLQKLVPNSSKTDKASMLDEVIEYVKKLQAHVHMMSKMNMPSMMMPLAMQQQQQMQMAMMNSMGMGMGMGGMMDMNTICPNFQVGFHPSTFMHMPSWNHRYPDQVTNTTAMAAADPMSAFLASQPQPPLMTMDAYSRMAALYQHMQNQTCGPLPKN